MLKQVLGVGLVVFFLLGNSDVAKVPTEITSVEHWILEMYPPITQWEMTYNGKIPAGATVRWYVRHTDNVQVLAEGEFSTDKAASKLIINGEDGFVCEDFSEDDNYHELYVIITAPSFSLVSVSKIRGSGCHTVPPLPDPDND